MTYVTTISVMAPNDVHKALQHSIVLLSHSVKAQDAHNTCLKYDEGRARVLVTKVSVLGFGQMPPGGVNS